MLARLRSAWRNYLASIPPPDDDAPVSDARILREDFRAPAVEPEVREAFSELTALVVRHLPPEAASAQEARLLSRLKPGVTPSQALSRWIQKCAGPKSTVGVIALDWKAREEVLWQATLLARAHGAAMAWDYAHAEDRTWSDWVARGLAPVHAPLSQLTAALAGHNLALIVFDEDDAVFAFAVDKASAARAETLCRKLGLALPLPVAG